MTDEQFVILEQYLKRIVELLEADQKPKLLVAPKGSLNFLQGDTELRNWIDQTNFGQLPVVEAIGKPITPIADPEYRERIIERDEW